MPVDRELAQHVVATLERLRVLDPAAMEALVRARVPCGPAFGDAPDVQVGVCDGTDGHLEVGVLGVLNAICGSYDDGPRERWGAVAAKFSESTPPFGHLERFELIENRLTTDDP